MQVLPPRHDTINQGEEISPRKIFSIDVSFFSLLHFQLDIFHSADTDFISGVFQCVREMNNDYEDVYVDGGLLCNYPIHAFDGMC